MVLGRDRVQGRESFGRSPGNPPVSRSQYGYTQRIFLKTLSDILGVGKRKTARVAPGRSRDAGVAADLEVHVAAATGGRGGRVLLRLLRDDRLGGEEQRRD